MVNERFSVEITSYTFVGAGEEIYGRLSPLYLVMDLKSLQVNIKNWKEKLKCEVEESQGQIKKPTKTGTCVCQSSPLTLTKWMTCRSRCPSSWNCMHA